MKPPNFPTEKVPKNRPIRGRRAEHRQQIAFLNAPGKRSEDRSGNRTLKSRYKKPRRGDRGRMTCYSLGST